MIACHNARSPAADPIEVCDDCESQNVRDIIASGRRPGRFYYMGKPYIIPTTCELGAERTTERRLFVSEGL